MYSGARLEVAPSALSDGFAEKVALSGNALVVDSYSGELAKTTAARFKCPADHHAAVIVREGTLLVWQEGRRRWRVIPPNTFGFAAGPLNLVVHLARGTHRIDIASWRREAAPILTQFLDSHRTQSKSRHDLDCVPINPLFTAAFDRLDRGLKKVDDFSELAAFSVFYEVLPKITSAKTEIGLAPLPPDIPPNLLELTLKVKNAPEQPWPLKEASYQVGYSPFHFSRVFKAIVGYGFHEFVDRCRTEKAVEMIVGSDAPLDVVGAASGFGTPQAMRESIKEYLGLVPSELRANPDESSKP